MRWQLKTDSPHFVCQEQEEWVVSGRSQGGSEHLARLHANPPPSRSPSISQSQKVHLHHTSALSKCHKGFVEKPSLPERVSEIFGFSVSN